MYWQLCSNSTKRGFWTNVDRGPILGPTITTDTTTGSIVVALLAILTTLGTAHLWNLVIFLAHQLRAKGQPSDTLFRQQQALLRTLPPPSSVIADLLKLGWTWRHKTRRPLLRTSFLVALATLFTVVTITASIFSSLVVDSSDIVVLVRSPSCSWVAPKVMASGEYAGSVFGSASDLCRQCYKEIDGPLPKACKSLFRPSLAYEVQKTSCPFNEGMCEQGAVISMDSGLLDLNEAFGLNLPDKDRVRFRRKATCAPLTQDGHTKIVNYNQSSLSLVRESLVSDEQVAILSYMGREAFENTTIFMPDGTWTKWFAEVSLVANDVNMALGINGWDRRFSDLDALLGPWGFEGASDLKVSAGDVVLMAARFGATYVQPVNDPFFSARQKIQFPAMSPFNGTLEYYIAEGYAADFPLKGLGCVDQYQFCHRRNRKDDFCSDLRGLPRNISQVNFPEASDMQQAALQLLLNVSYTFSFASRGISALQAQKIAGSKGTIEWLPDDQWITEVRAWTNQVWAAFQIGVADYAIGPWERNWGEEVDKNITDLQFPKNEAERALCGMQRMRISGNFVNINVFGLAFIVSFSCIVAILDITLLKFLIYMSRFRRTLAPRIDRWIQDGIWQLQRRAYEAHGHRDWINIEREIPLTTDEEKLNDLPLLWVPDKDRPSSPVSSLGDAI
ncbi:hypothetical protein K458DRAFT_57598 [Lentithecium fluviatile CBS 122367]|uniref:Uncharacterized protein n=1 Tax=Lentithecium fluviatile CBS 122367 TaxID=1168545 RepID=A0A6G1IVS8_9PLEO|nr:hypothetical protein K458DRAFT_57598 [Lentithecium fluviatile CBS 122367]